MKFSEIFVPLYDSTQSNSPMVMDPVNAKTKSLNIALCVTTGKDNIPKPDIQIVFDKTNRLLLQD